MSWASYVVTWLHIPEERIRKLHRCENLKLSTVDYLTFLRQWLLYARYHLLDEFAKLRKATITFVMSVCLSVSTSVRPHGTTRLPLHGFYEVWHLRIFRKSVEKARVSLKSDKNNGYFTWRPIYVSDHNLFNYSYNEKCWKQICREIKTHILCSKTFFENRAFY
jgi:hypothetical protein